jgi:alpha-glucosidase
LHNANRPYSVSAGSNQYVQVDSQSNLDQHDRATYFDSDTNTLYVKIPASESEKVVITDFVSDQEAEAAVVKAEKSLSQTDVDAATDLVGQLSSDSTTKTDLTVRLVKVQRQIDINLDRNAAVNAVIKAESSLTQTDVNAANALVNKLDSGDLKNLLLKHLSTVQQAINQKAEANKPSPDKKPAPDKKPDPAKKVLFIGYLTHKHAVRTGASSHKRSVVKLSAGASVKVLKAGKKWAMIRYKGANRYVWAKDVKKAKYTGKVIKKQALRSSYSVKSHVKTWLSKGTKVKVLSQGKHWDKVVYQGKLGYVWNSGIRK